MKNRRIPLVILIVSLVLITVLCGTVLAYMFRQTDYKNNGFTPAQVSCLVMESFDGEQKTDIKIKNTGNIDAYLRVRFVSYWVDGAGKIVAKPSPNLSFPIAEGWIAGSNNTYYYKSSVSSGNETSSLLVNPIVLVEEDGCKQVIEVFAEAIQSKPRDAVTNSWGVTVDSSGKITSVP